MGFEMTGFKAHETKDGYLSNRNKSDRNDNIDRNEILISIIILLIITCINIYFLQHIPLSHALLLITVVMSGAAGGILYAVRDSTLEWPKVTGGEIHLGWIADALYGISGAFAVCLIVPNFSESALNGFSSIIEEKPFLAAKSEEAGSNADLIEIIAVSIVGGFAGRSVLRMASDNIIKKELREMNQKVEETRIVLDQRFQKSKSDTMVLSMISQHLNNNLSTEQITELRGLMMSSSDFLRTMSFNQAKAAFLNNPGKEIATRVKVLFEILKECEQYQSDHQLTANLAEIYEFLGDYNNALKNIELPINLRKKWELNKTKEVSNYEE